MNSRKLLFLLGLVAFYSQALAQRPDTAWVSTYTGLIDAYDCAVDDSGHLFVIGMMSGEPQYITIKYDAITGDTIWTQRYNENYAGTACAVDSAGNLYKTGWSWNGTNYDFLAIKYNGDNGDTVWTRRYNNPNSSNAQASDCAVDDSGYLYVTRSSVLGVVAYCGQMTGYTVNNTVKYNALTGDAIWTRQYEVPDSSFVSANCAVDDYGYLYVSGYGANSSWIVKYNASTGDTVWTRHQFICNGFTAAANGVDKHGNLFIIGGGYVIKYDTATGDTIWTRGYPGPGNGDCYANDCVLDSNGYLYVTGSSVVFASGVYYLTVKYDVASGDTIWSARYPEQTSNNCRAQACAVDKTGNLYVTGNGNGNFLTIKYNTATGVVNESNISNTAAGIVLHQSMPNPVFGQATISYELPVAGFVKLRVYNMAGQLIGTVVDGPQSAGRHSTRWDCHDQQGRPTAAGVYFYHLKAGGDARTGKMVIMR